MAEWDVFHSERLEVERGLTTDQLRAGLASGDLRDDDLVRPAGTTTPWGLLVDLPELAEPEPPTTQAAVSAPSTVYHAEEDDEPFPLDAEFADEPDSAPGIGDMGRSPTTVTLGSTNIPPATTEDIGADPLGPDAIEDLGIEALIDDDEDADGLTRFTLDRESMPGQRPRSSIEALPAHADESLVAEVAEDEEDGAEDDDEDADAAEFTLTRGGPEKVEELDLAAMVDVAFQLVLFFLVTASTLVFKTLEVPAPKPEDASAAASQGSNKPEDLMDTYILVEVDPGGTVKVDHEPAPADLRGLSERLRAARASTGRLRMLLMADATTPHRNAVLAYDAANEVGLGIAIGRPTGANKAQ